MSAKKPTAEFLANQPYLYRGFENGGSKIEVYDALLDNWPTDAHLVVDGLKPGDPGVWWYQVRRDETDADTGERFTVLTFHDGSSNPPPDYIGTHNIQLVVNGQVARSVYLTILPWQNPTVEIIDEQEINGDLVEVTFQLTWPNDLRKTFAILSENPLAQPSVDFNGPWHGWVPGKFKISNDPKTGKTLVKGWTYRFIELSRIYLHVGAEQVSGVSDRGNLYSGCIDDTVIALPLDRGWYAQINPSTRAGFNYGAGFAWDGNTFYTVGGSATGLHPARCIFKKSCEPTRYGDPSFKGRFARSILRTQTPRPTWPTFDVTADTWKTDVSGSTPASLLQSNKSLPMFHPCVTIDDGVIRAAGGTVLIPDVRVNVWEYKMDGSRVPWSKVTKGMPWENDPTGKILEVLSLGDIKGNFEIQKRLDNTVSSYSYSQIMYVDNNGVPAYSVYISGSEKNERTDVINTSLEDGTVINGRHNKTFYIACSVPEEMTFEDKSTRSSIIEMMKLSSIPGVGVKPGIADTIWPSYIDVFRRAVNECVSKGIWAADALSPDVSVTRYGDKNYRNQEESRRIVDQYLSEFWANLPAEYTTAEGLSVDRYRCKYPGCRFGKNGHDIVAHDNNVYGQFGPWGMFSTQQYHRDLACTDLSWSFDGKDWVFRPFDEILTSGGY